MSFRGEEDNYSLKRYDSQASLASYSSVYSNYSVQSEYTSPNQFESRVKRRFKQRLNIVKINSHGQAQCSTSVWSRQVQCSICPIFRRRWDARSKTRSRRWSTHLSSRTVQSLFSVQRNRVNRRSPHRSPMSTRIHRWFFSCKLYFMCLSLKKWSCPGSIGEQFIRIFTYFTFHRRMKRSSVELKQNSRNSTFSLSKISLLY